GVGRRPFDLAAARQQLSSTTSSSWTRPPGSGRSVGATDARPRSINELPIGSRVARRSGEGVTPMITLHFPDPRRERLFRLFDERHAAPGIRRLATVALLMIGGLAAHDALVLGAARMPVVLMRGVMAATAAALLLSTFRPGGAGRWSGRLLAATLTFG